ncbi:hydrogenase maturation protease [Nitrogeniibacter mangrovi]|uniref:Hydrogenase maturation protease n=1 Tax=Nitrogeniibacter mangrovi TaxID=2016596 RepID=A0A6C1B5F6_9RHOO|nr:hydrogenase maturation protease [Nitrogeniibacter mangrovi]QID17464.1 hydrogenase maturation protease [Nitrogeniibacter mangrovi]
MASEPIHIVCVGNALHGDDGLGEAVWERLSATALPAHVRLHHAPFMGPAAVSCFEHCARVIVVDALSGFGAPGSVHSLRGDDVAAESSVLGHGAGLGQWLAQLPLWLDAVPAVEVVGVEMARLQPFSPGLSAPVREALPAVCARVLARMADG